MKRINQAFVMCLAGAFAAASSAAGAPGEENSACESQWPGGDFIEFRCPLPAHPTPQHWRFKADFAGGHDDTSASMTLTLDDQPVACAAGSKTRLFGEDGNVSLLCRFDAGGAGGDPPVLVVALLWSHAQYVRTALAVEVAGR